MIKRPYQPVGKLALIPWFLKELKSDILFLFTKDIEVDGAIPPGYDPVAARRVIKFAAARQAVRKQHIRESLHYRFGQCYAIFGIVTFPITLLGLFIWCYCYVTGVVFKTAALAYFLFN